MDDFWSILQLAVIVFFGVQVERMNHNLSNIQKTLTKICERLPKSAKGETSSEQ